MLRKIDGATGAKPLFAVSGIPGTVGSGTRSFWQELIPRLTDSLDFAVWPFEGDLRRLLASRGIVLAETYPALFYAAVLARTLPAPAKLNYQDRPPRSETAFASNCKRLRGSLGTQSTSETPTGFGRTTTTSTHT